jgi:uncharacterized lipoprotein YajG
MRALIIVPLLGLTLLAGCGQPQNLLSEGSDLGPASSAEGVVRHGAITVSGEGTAEAVVLNSDNKSVIRRTGITSDPRNPSGMAARPAAWYEI